MRRGVVAKRCSCGSFWRKSARACGRCGSARFASWGFYVDTHASGAKERRKTVRSGFPSKEAAERELGAITTLFGNGTYAPPSDQPLQDYLGAWLKARTHLPPDHARRVRDHHRALPVRWGPRDRRRATSVPHTARDQALLR